MFFNSFLFIDMTSDTSINENAFKKCSEFHLLCFFFLPRVFSFVTRKISLSVRLIINSKFHLAPYSAD